MNNGSISQRELDALFGANGGLETMYEVEPVDTVQHVWIIKNLTTGGVCSGRCFNVIQAQSALMLAQKDYQDCKFEIMQVR